MNNAQEFVFDFVVDHSPQTYQITHQNLSKW